MLLTNTKAKILRAKDGKDAVDICQKNKVDLILMDIKMPEMDGVEATGFIKNNFLIYPLLHNQLTQPQQIYIYRKEYF